MLVSKGYNKSSETNKKKCRHPYFTQNMFKTVFQKTLSTLMQILKNKVMYIIIQ